VIEATQSRRIFDGNEEIYAEEKKNTNQNNFLK